MELNKEAKRATKILKDKTILKIYRHRSNEIGIEFTDGTRLFIDHRPEGFELSITEGSSD